MRPGLSEGVAASAGMAHDHGVLMVLPSAGTLRSASPPTWRFTAAMPVAPWGPSTQTGVPYIENLLATPFTLDAEGMLQVPEKGSGLGIELNPDAVAKYSS